MRLLDDSNFLARPSDEAQLDAAVQAIRSNMAEGIHMQCYNREEATRLQRYMQREHPGVRCSFDWIFPEAGSMSA